MRFLNTLLAVLIIQISFAQTWQDVGGGTNNSSHGLVTWNGQLIDLGSFNNPCNRVASWDGTSWSCLGGGVGIVARAGCVWDGKLVVVGDFWNVQQPCVGCNGVAVWDGVSWTPLGNGVNNDVLTCTVWNNELVIGGDFTQADGVPIARIAKWNGTIWESVGPIGVFDNDIRCMTEFEDELWVGGDFNNVGGCSACDGVVKYDPTTGTWLGGNSGVDLVGGVNESVRVLYVNPTDGNLYMGGEFPELIDGDAGITDYNMSGVAMYDGSNWYPLGTGLDDPSNQVPQAYCRAIHEYNGDVIVGGHFTTADGVACNKIAKWNSTTQTFSPMSQGFDGVGIDEYVKSAAVWNGIFFAGGAYTQAEGGPMDFIAQWYEAPVNQPTAWMNYSSTVLCGSGCIDFYDNSTNSPTSWTWTFPGSDTPSTTVQNPGSVCWSTPGTYTATLQACNAFGCNTQYLDIEVTNGATVSVNDASICTGGSATLTASPSSPGGTFLWSPGGETTQSITVSPGSSSTYSVTYSMPGCTSAPAISNVTVVTGYTSSEAVDVCQNSLYTYPDGFSETITSSTSHTSSLLSVEGCDSTVTTTVTMVTAYNQNENISVCPNTVITYPDGSSETIIAGTSHTSTLISLAGCDSIVVTNVSVNPTYNIAENISVCMNTNYTYPDGTTELIIGNTSHTSALNTNNGCDSIIVTNINVSPTYNQSENISVCSGDTFTYPDGTIASNITANESHTSLLLSINSCDSIIVTNLIVNPISNLSENISVCAGSSYTYPDGLVATNITANESHTSMLSSINGCDSIIVTNIAVVTTLNSSESFNVCQGSNYTYPDGTMVTNIQNNETHTSMLISAGGCDSIIITNLSVLNSYNTVENITLCAGEDYTYPDGTNSTNIQANESHTSSYVAVSGCDSLIQTNIIITSLPDNTVTVNNNQITANQNGANYQWVDCNNGMSNIAGETSQLFAPTANGSYAVVVTMNNCESTSACETISTIGIEELSNNTNFTIYPNPTSESITISTTTLDVEVDYILIDASGRIVLSGVNSIGQAITVKQLEAGTYTLLLNGGKYGQFAVVKQ